MDRLSVLKGHDSERAVLCLWYQPPEGNAAIGLSAFFKRLGHHQMDLDHPFIESADGQHHQLAELLQFGWADH